MVTRICLFGQFRITTDGVHRKFPTRKSVILFAYLLVNHGRPIPRGKLLGIVAGEWDEGRARRALKTTLWRIRGTIAGIPALELRTTRDTVSLTLTNGAVEVDALQFLRVADVRVQVGSASDLELLLDAESVYSGDFLEGFEGDWVESERRAFHEVYVDVLRKLGALHKSNSEFPRALRYYSKLVALDPLDEEAHRELMLLHYLSGNLPAALRQYASARTVLLNELGVSPSRETTDLWVQIRSQPRLHGLKGNGGRETLPGGILRDIPLVGREEVFGRLLTMLERAANGEGGVCIITGEMGVGKTKLAETLAVEAHLRGCEVLQGSCAALESSMPYQAIIQALWPRIESAQVATGKSALVLRNLIETLLPGSTARSTDAGDPLPFDRALLNECLLSLILEVTSKTPAILIIEDFHRADSSTENLLHVLLGRIAHMRLLVITTVRNSEIQAAEVVRGLVADGAKEYALTPLDAGEMKTLVGAALQTNSVPDRLMRMILHQSSGVPLFAFEILEGMGREKCLSMSGDGQESGSILLESGSFNVSSRIAEVIRRRIRLLGSRAMFLLCAAAVLGTEVRFELLEQFMEIPEDEFIENVERLVGAKLLQETDRGLKFPHEMTRLAALTLLSKVQLSKMHARAARLLERVSPSRAEDIAWHYERAGDDSQALIYYEISGDRAKAVHDNEDAVGWYTKAVRLLGDQSDTARMLRSQASILLKREIALDLLGRRADQSRDLDTVLGLAVRLSDPALLAQAEYLHSQLLSRLNHDQRALEAARRAANLFQSVGDVRGEGKALESIGTIYINTRNQREARSAFRTALSLYRRLGELPGQARALVSLGTLESFAGNTPKAIDYLDEAERIMSEVDDRRPIAGALLQRGIINRCIGQNQRSKAYLDSGVATMREIGDRIGEARGLSQLAYTHMTLGRLRESLRESLMAMKLARDARDIRAQIVFLNNSGYAIFRCLGDFRRAERCIFEAIEHVSAGQGKESLAIYYDTMVAILLDKGDYEGALRWAKQARALYRTWEGHFGYVGTEIDFRLGLAYLHLGQYARAHPLLERAVASWRKRSDLELLPHGVAALGELYLRQDNTTQALECAREIERLLRRADGLEQIQKVYWTQYKIFRRVGAHAAARKALKKAHRAVTEQAAGLKGRFRRKFLEAVPVNRDILAEVRSLSDVPVVELSGLDPARRIDERRRAILSLMTRAPIRQREIANRLGVSVRTVRSDVVALRGQGLLGSPPPP